MDAIVQTLKRYSFEHTKTVPSLINNTQIISGYITHRIGSEDIQSILTAHGYSQSSFVIENEAHESKTKLELIIHQTSPSRCRRVRCHRRLLMGATLGLLVFIWLLLLALKWGWGWRDPVRDLWAGSCYQFCGAYRPGVGERLPDTIPLSSPPSPSPLAAAS